MYPNQNGLHVYGEGMVSVDADTLKISLGVITDGLELQTAQVQNAEAITNVIQSLLGIGLKRDDIKTVDYRIDPQYRYEEGKQIFIGYRVTHMLEVSTNQINGAGKIVDTAVRNGANSVANVQFTVQDSTHFYQQALSIAAVDAVRKAETLAGSFGVAFNRIPYLILEEPISAGPVPLAFTSFKAEAQTQIEPGKLTIQARIKAYFHLMVK